MQAIETHGGRMKSKTAFVTGANGFLGANLVRELLAQGWEVTVFHRPASNLWRLKGLNVGLREGSFQDRASLEAALPEGTDAVFHLAAKVSFWRGDDAVMQRDNVEATRTLLETALLRRVGRFIHTSSVTAYGFSDRRVDESFPRDGLKSGLGYMSTKAQAELAVLEAVGRGLDAVILNPADVLGPLDTEHWGNSMRKVKEGKMPAAPPGSSSFVHAGEAAKAHVAAAEKGRKGENYILAGTDAPYIEVFSTMEDIVGVPHKVKAAPAFPLQVYAQASQAFSWLTGKAPLVTPELVKWLCRKMSYESGKAQKELGFQVRPLRQMLEDCWASLP